MNMKRSLLLFLVPLFLLNCEKDKGPKEKIITPYAHFSVDDVVAVLQTVTNNEYESIFEHSFFSAWKELHDNYGATVTLNLYYAKSGFDLSQMTEKYKSEFEANSSWLKFSFHAKDANQNYNSIGSNEAGLQHYNNTCAEVARFAGSDALETFCRFHYFSGNKDYYLSLKQSDYGLAGIHTADDTRDANSGLSSEERAYLNKRDEYYDTINDLYFIRSEWRLDKESIAATIRSFNKNYNDTLNSKIYNYFLHEPFVTKQHSVLDSLCKVIVFNEIRFDFPSNNIP